MEKTIVKPALRSFRGIIKHIRYSLIIYPNKIVFQSGIIARSETEIRLSDIRAVNVEQSMFQRVIGVGNLSIATAGTSMPEITIPSISKPKTIKKLILEMSSLE